jgi:hypothetical protein
MKLGYIYGSPWNIERQHVVLMDIIFLNKTHLC